MLLPTPAVVAGVAQPVIVLDGEWWYRSSPLDEGWPKGPLEGCQVVEVPGEPAMQGFAVSQDAEQAYYAEVAVPADFAGQRAILRFDGVYDYARLFVNGRFVRDHVGGFTRWEADISDLVQPGQSFLLSLGVTDRSGSISRASAYAGHAIGGVLRSVYLMAVPPVHLWRAHVRTDLGPALDSAFLQLDIGVSSAAPGGVGAELSVGLEDPGGQPVETGLDPVFLRPGQASLQLTVPLASPSLWTAETPDLYRLSLDLSSGPFSERVEQRIGVRTVTVQGNKLLVNGRPVTLRGVNRHDLDPRLGRCSNAVLDREDVRVLKEANINFVRTSHYPPGPALVEAADELGLYLEVESAVCWAGMHGHPATQDEPARTAEYLGQFAEMVERDRNHPSVVLWSLGNESAWGTNFAAELAHVRRVDGARPVIMSYPAGAEDVVSSHYPAYGSDLANPAQPVLYDEAAHVLCYRPGDLRRDPAVQLDWGCTLGNLVEQLEQADGALGLAIWAGVDEIFHLPQGVCGYGPWGILDIWRRRKPEWWSVKRAYAPVRLTSGAAVAEGQADGVVVGLENRHDFLNLSAFSIRWHLGDHQGAVPGPDVAPHNTGFVTLPVGRGATGQLTLEFVSPEGRVVDEHVLELTVAGASPGRPERTDAWTSPAVHWARPGGRLTAEGGDGALVLVVDTASGCLEQAELFGHEVLVGGPYLHVAGPRLPPWHCDAVEAGPVSSAVRIHGHYGPLEAAFDLRLHEDRSLVVSYQLGDFALEAPFGLVELGLSFDLSPPLSCVRWRSRAEPWVTPGDHLGRATGAAQATSEGGDGSYGDRPAGPWEDDAWDTFLDGPASAGHFRRDFRARRRELDRFEVTRPDGIGVVVRALKGQAARVGPATEVIYPDDDRVKLSGGWRLQPAVQRADFGSRYGPDVLSSSVGAQAVVNFYGTGIEWVASRGPDLGIAEVWLDGALARPVLDCYSAGRYHEPTLYSATGLASGRHELRIIATGRGRPQATAQHLAVGYFVVYPHDPVRPRLVVLDHESFPWDRFAWAPASLADNAGRVRSARGSTVLAFTPGTGWPNGQAVSP